MRIIVGYRWVHHNPIRSHSNCKVYCQQRKPVFCSPIGTSMNQPMEKPGPVNFPLQTANIRKSDTAVILHSSGSTGLPKPLYLSNNALVSQMRYGPGLSSFNSLPWYHLYGLTTALQAMYSCNTAFMWDVSRPLTANSLTQALDIAKPASVHCVPYTLQLLIETPNGIDRRRSCKMATYGGAPCPGELGDLLVANGVRLGGLFGSYVSHGPFHERYADILEELRQVWWPSPSRARGRPRLELSAILRPYSAVRPNEVGERLVVRVCLPARPSEPQRLQRGRRLLPFAGPFRPAPDTPEAVEVCRPSRRPCHTHQR